MNAWLSQSHWDAENHGRTNALRGKIKQLLILIYLHYVEAPLAQVCTLGATREQ